MASLDDLFAQIPTREIASRLGADESEVNNAIHRLVPALVGGLQENAQNPAVASEISSAVNSHAARGLLDTGVQVDQVDESEGQQAIAKIFGGNDSGQVAAALSGGGGGDNQLFQKLLPILTPIVLAYIGKQLSDNKASAPGKQGSGGALGEVLGSILSEASGGKGNKSLGSILGNALGSKAGEILGGLFGGKNKN
jgi:hypothetical protein